MPPIHEQMKIGCIRQDDHGHKSEDDGGATKQCASHGTHFVATWESMRMISRTKCFYTTNYCRRLPRIGREMVTQTSRKHFTAPGIFARQIKRDIKGCRRRQLD